MNFERMGSAKVWVLFENKDESKRAFDALNNQFFRGRRIYMSFATEYCFDAVFVPF